MPGLLFLVGALPTALPPGNRKRVQFAVVQMRIALVAGLSLACVTAQAELTCEQLGAVAQTTVELRNQGNTLNALLAEARRDGQGKYTEQEMTLIRNLIRHSYDSTVTPAEVLEACKQDTKPAPPR